MTTVLQLLWLALPIIAAGLVHLAVMKLDLWPALRRMPIDGGLTFRGKRLFGDNQTWRGALVTIGTTMLAAGGVEQVHACCGPRRPHSRPSPWPRSEPARQAGTRPACINERL